MVICLLTFGVSCMILNFFYVINMWVKPLFLLANYHEKAYLFFGLFGYMYISFDF